MKGHRLLVFLVIAILWVFSLAVVGYIATPNTPLDQNPQAEDYNSSRSNTTMSIYIGTDNSSNLWIGVLHITPDGVIQAGTDGGNSIEVKFDEYGNIIVGELRHSPELDGKILAALNEALSLWEKEMTTGGGEIALAPGASPALRARPAR